MAGFAACVFFLIFLANVLIGATTGSPLIDDVPEALLLFAASIFFVAVILRREAQARVKAGQK